MLTRSRSRLLSHTKVEEPETPTSRPTIHKRSKKNVAVSVENPATPIKVSAQKVVVTPTCRPKRSEKLKRRKSLLFSVDESISVEESSLKPVERARSHSDCSSPTLDMNKALIYVNSFLREKEYLSSKDKFKIYDTLDAAEWNDKENAPLLKWHREKRNKFADPVLHVLPKYRQKYFDKMPIAPLSATYIGNRISITTRNKPLNEDFLRRLEYTLHYAHRLTSESPTITGERILQKLGTDGDKEFPSSVDNQKPFSITVIYGNTNYSVILDGCVIGSKKYFAALYRLHSVWNGSFYESSAFTVVNSVVPRCYYKFCIDVDKLLGYIDFTSYIQEIHFCKIDKSILLFVANDTIVDDIICYCIYQFCLLDIPPQAVHLYIAADKAPLEPEQTYESVVNTNGRAVWYLFCADPRYDVDITADDLKDECIRRELAWTGAYDFTEYDGFGDEDATLESSLSKLSFVLDD